PRSAKIRSQTGFEKRILGLYPVALAKTNTNGVANRQSHLGGNGSTQEGRRQRPTRLRRRSLRRSGSGRIRPPASLRGQTTSSRLGLRSGDGLDDPKDNRNQGQLLADYGVVGESAPPPLGTATRSF